jgi:type I restriction enzyme R subunit
LRKANCFSLRTPIFADNASKNEMEAHHQRFIWKLPAYVITDAIRDENVLRFGIEYVGNTKTKSKLL